MILETDQRSLENAQQSFPCYKKAKVGDKKFFAYLLPNFLLLIKEKETKPRYELPIELSTHIKWEVQEIDDVKRKSKIVAFKFQQVKRVNHQSVGKVTMFKSDEENLLKLKDLLRNRIIFQRIQDVYTPLQTLGKGSSARVLLVRHKNTEKYYAAKCIDKAYVNESENGIESFFQEIKIQRDMKHTSFINLHAVYEGDNTFYMVMDLLEGKSLHDELNNYKSGFPIEICKIIMLQILQGIEYMHSLDIMHRDLKPENIMLQRKNDLNSLKIVDFGLATYQYVEKYIFPKCGTPGYVAPEIANLEDKTIKYDKVCDIFSAGVIFFKIVTGKDLFPGSGFNLVLKLNKQCKIDLTPLQMKKTPQNVVNIISRMLDKDPKNRPSASSILQDSFFQDVEKPKATPQQKKQFFQSLKGDKLVQTAELGVHSDEHTHHRPPNSQIKQIQSPNNGIQQTGSFVVQDNAFKGYNVSQPSKFQKVKFNTSEFEQYDFQQQQLNSPYQKYPDKIEEEEEHIKN